MIYALYHTVTQTEMDENGLPGWVDVLGGLLDAVILVGLFLLLTDPHAYGGGFVP